MANMRTAFRLFLALVALPALAQAVDGKAASVTSGIVPSLFEADTRFVLQDGDTRVLAECAPDRPPKVGSRIRVHGKPGANRWGERLLMVDSFDELAAGEAPPPADATAETLTHPDMNLRTVRATGRVIDIFIDEIDAVGRQRGSGLGGGHDEREQTLNQLLVEMDGFGNNEGVIVMAATNRADILDNALLRPGRFDRQVYVGYPDCKGREEILKIHARGKPLAEDVDLKQVAQGTAGFTGAGSAGLTAAGGAGAAAGVSRT